MISEGFDKRMIKNGNDSRKHDDQQIKRFEELHVDLSINTFLYKVTDQIFQCATIHMMVNGLNTSNCRLRWSHRPNFCVTIPMDRLTYTHVHTRPYIVLEILTYCIQLLLLLVATKRIDVIHSHVFDLISTYQEKRLYRGSAFPSNCLKDNCLLLALTQTCEVKY